MNALIEYNKKAHTLSISKYKKAEELYTSKNISLSTLAKLFKFNRTKFSKYLKNKGIQVVNKQNECKFNQYVFDNINTEEKAYWLGFVYADGYISNRDNNIEVSLKLSDKNHLEKLKNFLEWSGNIKTDHFRCRLSISNKHLKQILILKGCPPKKSLILQFPNNNIINGNLLPHFIRGYFDGDGSIYISKKEKSKSNISLLGTNIFLKKLLTITNWKKNKLFLNSKDNPNTWVLSYGGKTALNILNILYKDASVYLDRKYKKYEKYCRLYE